MNGLNGGSSLNSLVDECTSWLELESDPGLFTLLIDDFGVKGVQVEEIYDLSKPLDSSIFGFIFLFKWIERRSRRSKSAGLDASSNYVTDPNLINKMFFAHQIVPNSCATHALLSILLNCKSRKFFDLGELLTKFQNLCEGMSPEIKGLAIGNQPKLAEAHNSYAKPETCIDKIASSTILSSNQRKLDSSNNATTSAIASSSGSSSSCTQTTNQSNFYNSTSSGNNLSLLASTISSTSNTSNEIFHFICFVPINGRLYELDGLKPYPIDHGPINTNFSNNFYYYDSSNASTNGENTSSAHNNLANVLLNATNLANSNNFNWTNKFKQIIKQRLNSFNSGHTNHEIRFNLMAVVPDKMFILREQIELINDNRVKIEKVINYHENGLINGSNYESTTSEDISCSKQHTIKLEFTDQLFQNETKNSISIPNDNEVTQSILNTRQLRSNNSTPTLKSNKLSNNNIGQLTTNKDDYNYEIRFNLKSNDIVNELIDNCNNNILKLKANLDHLIERNFDSNELSKLFKIEKIINLNENDNFNDENNDNNVVKKLVSLSDLKIIALKLKNEIELSEVKFNDEIEKRKKYKIDALRRKHAYDEFIVNYLKILAENGKLAEIVRSKVLGTSDSPNNQNIISSCSSIFLQPPNAKKSRKK